MAPPRDTNVTSVLDEAPAFTRQRPGGTFLVIKGPDRGEQVHLSNKPVTFGSAPACDLVLTDKTVSRRHADGAARGRRGAGARPRLDQRHLHPGLALQGDHRRLRRRDQARPHRHQVPARRGGRRARRGRGRHLRSARRARHQDAAAVRAARGHRAERRDRAHRGRDRHRQGADRRGDPQPLAPRQTGRSSCSTAARCRAS